MSDEARFPRFTKNVCVIYDDLIHPYLYVCAMEVFAALEARAKADGESMPMMVCMNRYAPQPLPLDPAGKVLLFVGCLPPHSVLYSFLNSGAKVVFIGNRPHPSLISSLPMNTLPDWDIFVTHREDIPRGNIAVLGMRDAPLHEQIWDVFYIHNTEKRVAAVNDFYFSYIGQNTDSVLVPLDRQRMLEIGWALANAPQRHIYEAILNGTPSPALDAVLKNVDLYNKAIMRATTEVQLGDYVAGVAVTTPQYAAWHAQFMAHMRGRTSASVHRTPLGDIWVVSTPPGDISDRNAASLARMHCGMGDGHMASFCTPYDHLVHLENAPVRIPQ